jgi:preprotein translocase subunit SecD
MNFYARCFNLYLLSLAVGLAVVTGCQSDKKKPEKQVASMRIHIENRAQLTTTGETVSVLRSSPVLVTIGPEPILTEANITAARVLQTEGGYAIEVQFNSIGTYILEQYSSANSGKHLVIFCQWSELGKDSRWIAAPIITHRIPNGVLSFSPDASEAETKLIVTGLNNMAKQIAKGKLK